MELQNPDHEELKVQLEDVETFKLPIETTPQPHIEGVLWTPEVRDAWRAKHRGDNMTGLVLNSLTYDEIIART